MQPDEPLLLTVLDRPNDVGPRLVYADWLEERGECRRAELIRAQCGATSSERVGELIRTEAAHWAGTAAQHAYCFSFRRGFVEEITIAASSLLRYGEQIFAETPVRLLRIIGARAHLERLVEWPLLARVEALHLTGCHLGDDGAALVAECRYLVNLRTLRLGQNAINDGGAEALSDSPWLTRLETLVLHGNLIGDAGAHVLAAADTLARLQVLDLSDNMIGDAGAEALARCKGFAGLTRLDLSNQFKGGSSGLTLRGRPYPIQPRQQDALRRRFGEHACVF